MSELRRQVQSSLSSPAQVTNHRGRSACFTCSESLDRCFYCAALNNINMQTLKFKAEQNVDYVNYHLVKI